MRSSWTFSRRLAVGFAVIVVAFAIVAVTGLRTTQSLIANDELVSHTHEVRTQLNKLLAALIEAETSERGFVITGADRFLEPYRAALDRLDTTLVALRRLTTDNPGQQRRLDELGPLLSQRRAELDAVIEARRTGGLDAGVARVSSARGAELTAATRRLIGEMEAEERTLLDARQHSATAAAETAAAVIEGGGAVAVALALVIGWLLSRSLVQRIGSAALQVQTSSAELQSAANQQVSGARDQVTAMSEISTTMTELLATSRQISDSATRVSQIARQTGDDATAGGATVTQGNEAIAQIRRQVDVIVGHMLELGKKSQQAGAVLDIVAELAEQTNIVAINAAIEAAGAGDAGLRFGVVADEIRKLADRVATSTKDIRATLDGVRGAVTATVMATETGAKAVDTGAAQVADLGRAFRQIAAQVAIAVEATREIELSTKQQVSAVEQVHVAIAGLAQTTRETEAGASQTLQTSSQLTSLSTSLTRLVQTT
ncbi:MAG TPA: CHASE3 domain-containing protein [Kofleriaceae bacterium]|jgi:CHASE3 domain sensor protein|nr:CHASE3 domain-containing protein [Kofleriaceae bacterium]